MKNLFFLFSIIFTLIASSCSNKGNGQLSGDLVKNNESASGKISNENMPIIEFDKTVHDFGKITQGEKVMCSFRFKNVGKSDLLISEVKASCGCTAPDFSKDPIKPGADGKIDISFNSQGKYGLQSKLITVLANTQPNSKVLTIKANIVVPEK